MGSLVLTQVAPGIAQHSHHPTMVGGNSRQDESSDPATSRHSRDRSVSDNSSLMPIPSSSIPATPRSPAIQPRSTNPTPSSASRPQPIIHEPSTAQSESTSRTQSVSYHSQISQHNWGYDQSGFPLGDPVGLASSSPTSPRLQPTYRSSRSLGGSEATSPSRIKVKNLSHIQSFASEELLARPRMPRTGSMFGDPQRQYEISSMPVTDIIEMVAGLLTKITTTNDQQHEHVHRPIPPPEEQSTLHPQTSCVLAFHGKNVPSITILSYLSRIHKYCPTTYEVFLSLLVYFDRMTEHVNKGFLSEMRRQPARTPHSPPSDMPASPMPMNIDSPETHVQTPPSSGSINPQGGSHESIPPAPSVSGQDLSQFFVVDSYNIHRLVIAGVTCASKFFSDVFYTNSRYAKVGGLPLAELNHLELQFLLLNDFRLSVPVEELEAYGTMLVEFYAREIIAQQQAQAQAVVRETQGGGGLYMRDSRSTQHPTAS